MRERFFVKYPALIVSLFFLLGLAASFQCIFLLFTALSLVFFLRSPQRLLGYLLISSLAYSYGLWKLEQFPSTETSLQGFAACTIQTIQESKTHFSTGYIGKGFIHSLIDEEGKKAANISCYIQIPAAMRPLSTKHYLIHGTLEKKEEGKFRFIPTKDLPWVPGKTATLCLAELRFTITCYLQKRIESLYPSPRIHHFLCALLLGDHSDFFLQNAFGKLGLQHILAISGFHFGLLALFLGGMFCRLLPEKLALILLLICLSLYFLLLGPTPSVTRAYLAIVLYLIGKLSNKQTKSLNIFGAVLLLELILDPHAIRSLSFQLSFLATASILFLYPLTFSWVAKLLPLRDSATLTRFPPLDRLLYLGTSFLRSSCALNLAVHMTTLPVCLFYFHKFPLASFLYNLCIPLATSFALFLFFCSLPCFLLCPPLAGLITQGNTWFLDRLLCIVQESPACLNVFLTAPTIPLSCLLLIQVSIFLFPFLAQKIKERKALVSPSQSIAWPKTALRQGRDSLAASVDRSVLFSPSTHE